METFTNNKETTVKSKDIDEICQVSIKGWTDAIKNYWDFKHEEFLIKIHSYATLFQVTLSGSDAQAMSATAAMGNLMYLKYYLEYRGIDIESTNNNKQTPLICACDWGHPEAVKFLIEKGANVNARDAVGRTALMYFDYDNPEITKLLIDAGADVNAKDHTGYTALMHAYMQNHIKIMKLLKIHGAFKMSQDANFDKCLLENSSLIKEIKKEQWDNIYKDTIETEDNIFN